LEQQVNINCPHFDQCSGCQYNINVADISVYTSAKEFFSKKGYNLSPIQTGNPTGWRTRAKLAIRGDSIQPKIGLFEEGSHRIVDIPQCRVHHPSINAIVEKIKDWITKEKISIYNEEKNKGLLRYVQCSEERKSGRVQVVLVLNGPLGALKEKLLEFYRLEKEILHSLWVNINQRKDNVIFGDEWLCIAGEELLWEDLCGVSICFHPACFCQANLDMYERLIGRLRDQIPSQAKVLEMYAGVGSIGLCLVDKASSVCCVEISPEARHCFEHSMQRLSLEDRKKISLHVSSAAAESILLATLSPSVLIVDPPRKGLDSSLMKAINTAVTLEKIIYVSCGWTSFQRDCDMLLGNGWKISFAEPYLFFPGTTHLELFAVFERDVAK
jgi:23S rRNA (uracil-5-)-methyltransferase RumA